MPHNAFYAQSGGVDNDLPVTDCSPGVAPIVAGLVTQKPWLKCHSAVCDYLQWVAVHYALIGENVILPIIVRTQDEPYQWADRKVPLSDVANQEKTLPAEFIGADGFHITPAARRNLSPLIETYPPYRRGLSD